MKWHQQIISRLWKNRRLMQFVLFIIYSLFIIYYTLLSRKPSASHRLELRFMWAYREMLTGHPEWKEDVCYNIENILFFIPFGFLFPKKKWKSILLVGVLFSIFIEITQYIACLGLCELDDVICNGLGALIGHWLYVVVIVKHRLIEKFSKGLNE